MNPRAPWASVKARVAALAIGRQLRPRSPAERNMLYGIARRIGYRITSNGPYLKRIG